jgi:chorismate lyase/3-hydroxybenzoate synthase
MTSQSNGREEGMWPQYAIIERHDMIHGCRTFRIASFPLQPQPPGWAIDLRDGNAEQFALLSGSVDDALALGAGELADAVAALYRRLDVELKRRQRHAIRIWNFLPDIQGHLDGGDRYMAFNAGRFAAYCDWFGGIDAFPAVMPTASAVGVGGSRLSVHVLAADKAGVPVENPRQVPPYYYSRTYGERPPCFSRATKVGSTLLIGGTASILGQDSEHDDDLEAQTRETCRNIAALISAAAPDHIAASLDALSSLRVHVRETHHVPAVEALLDELVPNVPIVELVEAPLCRRELLVEVEGVAELSGRDALAGP